MIASNEGDIDNLRYEVPLKVKEYVLASREIYMMNRHEDPSVS